MPNCWLEALKYLIILTPVVCLTVGYKLVKIFYNPDNIGVPNCRIQLIKIFYNPDPSDMPNCWIQIS